MEGNPASRRGSLTSKPTWPDALGYSATSAFFVVIIDSTFYALGSANQ